MAVLDTEPRRRGWDRSTTFTWDVGPGANHWGDPCTLQVVLTVYHHADHKAFVARFYPQQYQDRGAIGITSGDPFAGVTIATLPVPRYSAKAQDAFADAALAALRERQAEPAIAAVLEVSAQAA